MGLQQRDVFAWPFCGSLASLGSIGSIAKLLFGRVADCFGGPIVSLAYLAATSEKMIYSCSDKHGRCLSKAFSFVDLCFHLFMQVVKTGCHTHSGNSPWNHDGTVDICEYNSVLLHRIPILRFLEAISCLSVALRAVLCDPVVHTAKGVDRALVVPL